MGAGGRVPAPGSLDDAGEAIVVPLPHLLQQEQLGGYPVRGCGSAHGPFPWLQGLAPSPSQVLDPFPPPGTGPSFPPRTQRPPTH